MIKENQTLRHDVRKQGLQRQTGHSETRLGLIDGSGVGQVLPELRHDKPDRHDQEAQTFRAEGIRRCPGGVVGRFIVPSTCDFSFDTHKERSRIPVLHHCRPLQDLCFVNVDRTGDRAIIEQTS